MAEAVNEREQGSELYIIDVSSFIFRAYHALPPLTNSKGMPTGAIFGFCNMLLKLMEDHRPAYLAAAVDSIEPSFRKEAFPDYKANRPPAPEDLVAQMPVIPQALDAFRVPVLGASGYEADDVIATLVERLRAEVDRIVVVSSDKDLMQLVSDRVQLLDTMKGKVWDPEAVRERFGVDPAKVGDWLALVGDTSDNIPGVPGVGAKTATKLLGAHGSLEGVLEAAEAGALSGRLEEKIRQHAAQARLSRKLVTLATDASVDESLSALGRQAPDDRALADLFGELEFERLGARFGGHGEIDRSCYRTVLSESDLAEVVGALREAGVFAFDLETTSLDPQRAEIVGVALSWAAGEACYIPTGHRYVGAPTQLALATVLEALRDLLQDQSVPKFAQNHKYDARVLMRAGVSVQGVTCDPMIASYLLDPSRNSHGLDALARAHLGHEMISYKSVVGKEGAFESVAVDQATAYAAEDADATYRIATKLAADLDRHPELERLNRTLELPVASVLIRMEAHGCLVDTGCLDALRRELSLQLEELLKMIQQEAGWPVNPNSPKQLQRFLFDELGLAPGRKTKTGRSTDADVLAELAAEHPIAARIDEWRSLTKLKGGYLDALPRLVDPQTGRIHTSYHQAVAATGRLSSSDPNLQNIPVRGEIGRRIREAFVAPEGWCILSADYSQVELRILAHLSQDALLLDAFRRGQDVHRRTAAEVFGLEPDEVAPEHRRVAKAVNFGVIYGQTDYGLGRQLRIPRATAAKYIEQYFARHAGVKRYMEQTIAEARDRGVVRTLYGRRRPIPDINARPHQARAYAERVARNTPIQGTAADLIKRAMVQVDAALAEAGLEAPMILTVHDELVFEVRPRDLDRVKEIVVEGMKGALELDIPLVVDTGVGANWSEAH